MIILIVILCRADSVGLNRLTNIMEKQVTDRDSVISLQTNRRCHFANIGLMLIHRSKYRVCWDAPKSMHTSEMDIFILKCPEVIICINIILLFKL